MGSFFSKIQALFGTLKKESRILMIGLDAAGKTSILNKLHLNEMLATVPTIGFSVERVEYKNLEMVIWDVGGQSKIRPLWKFYMENTDAVIWVVDSSDKDRFEEAKEELEIVLSNDLLRDAVLLVFANKMDLPGCASVKEVSQELGLHKLKNRKWFIQGCTATTGDGLHNGLDFLVTAINDK